MSRHFSLPRLRDSWASGLSLWKLQEPWKTGLFILSDDDTASGEPAWFTTVFKAFVLLFSLLSSNTWPVAT